MSELPVAKGKLQLTVFVQSELAAMKPARIQFHLRQFSVSLIRLAPPSRDNQGKQPNDVETRFNIDKRCVHEKCDINYAPGPGSGFCDKNYIKQVESETLSCRQIFWISTFGCSKILERLVKLH